MVFFSVIIVPLMGFLDPDWLTKFIQVIQSTDGKNLYSAAITVGSVAALGWMARQNNNLRKDLKASQEAHSLKDLRQAEWVAASQKSADRLNEEFFKTIQTAMKVTPQTAELGVAPNPEAVVNVIADQAADSASNSEGGEDS